MDPDVAALLDATPPSPFTKEEIANALHRMAPNKSTGLAQYAIDVLKGAGEPLLGAIQSLFTVFQQHGYPSALNTLLILPLYKSKEDASSCDNYRPISLIHPLGRLFAKCVENRMANDEAAQRTWG